MEYIKKAGYNTFIADEYVHQIYMCNKEGYLAIKKAFGANFITKKEVNRKALGNLVFKNKNALKKLNKIMNPIIKKAILNLDKKQDWFIELATYLYYPQDFKKTFDKIVLVFNNQNWKNIKQKEKFSYLEKLPTFFVENSKSSSSSILYIGSRELESEPINVDIFVNNSKNKINLKKNILKVCKNLTQHIIK